MEQLLIIEDDIGLNQGLSKALKANDRQIISCHDLKAAREQLLCGSVSLILLDINLPDGSGLELLREVKENTPYIPVILLTANDTDLDIVDGLERGADDYITKPFSLSVLRARVNTQLRKQASSHKNAPIHIDLFHFDFEAMTFYVGDSKVELSKTEQKLLRLLVENRGRTMTRGDLVDRIWTDGAEYVDENGRDDPWVRRYSRYILRKKTYPTTRRMPSWTCLPHCGNCGTRWTRCAFRKKTSCTWRSKATMPLRISLPIWTGWTSASTN